MHAEVTCVAWRPSQDVSSLVSTLVTASDDMRHQIWRAPHTVLDPEEVRFRLEILNKKENVRIISPPTSLPATPRTSSKTSSSRISSKRMTPSIKTFLTPKHFHSPRPELTPTNEEKRGLKRRQCSFNNENSPETSQSVSRNLSSSISSLLSSPSSKCSFTAETYRSPSKKVSCSPVKRCHITPKRIASPLKLFSPLREIRPPQSPTANLPNFNIDGRSPRAIPNRVVRERKVGVNWLTAYAKEKKQGSDSIKNASKLKDAIGSIPSKNSQGFAKQSTRKGSKKKIVKLK